MRTVLTLMGVMLAGSAAAAAELPLKGAYGTAAGCAAVAGVTPAPQGDAIAFIPAEVRNDGLICNYTTIHDQTADPANPAFEVIVRCAEGHDSELAMTLHLLEHPGEKLVVELIDGDGPKGDFAACPIP